MSEHRNITILPEIEITDWNETDKRLIVDAKWDKDLGDVEESRECGTVGSDLSRWMEPPSKAYDTPWGRNPVSIRRVVTLRSVATTTVQNVTASGITFFSSSRAEVLVDETTSSLNQGWRPFILQARLSVLEASRNAHSRLTSFD